jgi:hypothetical protein
MIKIRPETLAGLGIVPGPSGTAAPLPIGTGWLGHPCVAHAKNQAILEYLSIDPDHGVFV